jgi:hypothetical protein
MEIKPKRFVERVIGASPPQGLLGGWEPCCCFFWVGSQAGMQFADECKVKKKDGLQEKGSRTQEGGSELRWRAARCIISKIPFPRLMPR